MFLKPDFALEEPSTFDAVLPWSHFNGGGGRSSRDVASSKLLQEKVGAMCFFGFSNIDLCPNDFVVVLLTLDKVKFYAQLLIFFNFFFWGMLDLRSLLSIVVNNPTRTQVLVLACCS